MKKCIWIALILFSLPTYANDLDSLLQVVYKEKEVIPRSDYYLNYLNKLARIDRDSAMNVMKRYEDSCGTQFDYGRYRCQSLRAFYLCFESRYEESLRLLHEALVKQKAIADESGIAQTMNRLGLVNNYFEHFDQAMHYLTLARAAFIRLQDSARLDAVLNNMGAICSSNGQHTEAISYYRQSLAIRLNREDFFWVGYSYYNIGQVYVSVNMLDSARYYSELALHTFENRTAAHKAPPMVHLGLGRLYLETKELNKAYGETVKGLDGAQAIGQTELLLEGKPLLSQILFAQKKYKAAYEIQQEYLELKLSVDSSNNAQAVAEIEAKYRNSEQALEIQQLSTQKLNAENNAQRLSLYIIGAVAILILSATVISLLWFRRNQREKMDRSVLNTRIAEAKMFALRTQMNPHFIFNCINTAQHFVMNNQQQQAYDYLSNFAKLLRLVVEHSARTFVPLEDELQHIKLYLELEAIRFDHKFGYTIKLDSELGNGIYEIPGMLIQPILENAIGHGLLNRKDEKGELLLQLRTKGDCIVCEVTDNGVGRKRASEIKAAKNTHYQSAAIPNITERLNLLHLDTAIDVSMEIIDLEENGVPSGTRVILYIPYR